MNADFEKYTKVKVKAPNSPRAEQVNKVVEITGKSFLQILGLTRHLEPDVMYRLFQESKGDPRLWWWHYQNNYKKNNMSKIMIEKLEKFPELRERKFKNLYLAKWTLKEVFKEKETRDANGNLEKEKTTLLDKQKKGQMFTMNEFAQFGKVFCSLDRRWRDTLAMEKNKHLRGSDYEMKDELEIEAQRNLGYNV